MTTGLPELSQLQLRASAALEARAVQFHAVLCWGHIVEVQSPHEVVDPTYAIQSRP